MDYYLYKLNNVTWGFNSTIYTEDVNTILNYCLPNFYVFCHFLAGYFYWRSSFKNIASVYEACTHCVIVWANKRRYWPL